LGAALALPDTAAVRHKARAATTSFFIVESFPQTLENIEERVSIVVLTIAQ
jgi:hypothetical protein